MSRLDGLLERAAGLRGDPLPELFEQQRFEELLDIVEDLTGNQEPWLLALHAELRDQQRQVGERLQRAIERHEELDEPDVARRMLLRLKRAWSECPELPRLEASIARLEAQASARRDLQGQIQEAYRLSGESAFLQELRDARSIYESLLDRADVIGKHVDVAGLRQLLQAIQRRIREAEAHQAAIGTNAALEALGPNLEALAALRAMQAQGEVEVALSGVESVPIVNAIRDLEARVRPRLGQVVGRHLTDARRLADERGDERAALRRLRQHRDAWVYLDDEQIGELEELDSRLARSVERAERIERTAERVLDCIHRRDFGEAFSVLTIEVGRLGEEPENFKRLRDTAMGLWLPANQRALRKLERECARLATPDTRRIRAVIERLDAFEAGLEGVEHREADALHERCESLSSLLRGVEDVAELFESGALLPAGERLDSLAEELPDYAKVIATFKRNLGFRLTSEEALLQVRELHRDDPQRAMALAREHVSRDRRFVEFIDFAVIQRALTEAEGCERAGQYFDGIACLQSAQAELARREAPRLQRALDRLRQVARDAPAVADLFEQMAKARSRTEKETLAAALETLTVGADCQAEADVILRLQMSRHQEALSLAVDGWKRGDSIDPSAANRHAHFLRKHLDSPPAAIVELLEDHHAAVELTRSEDALSRGAPEQARTIAEALLGGRYDARVVELLTRVRARMALQTAHAAIGKLELSTARDALADAPDTIEEVRSARLLVEKLDPQIRLLLDPELQQSQLATDPVDAFGRVRELLDGQPESDAFEQCLALLSQARLEYVRESCAALRKTKLPGGWLAQMSLLQRDFEAAAGVAPELELLVQEVDREAETDLQALLAWIREHATQADTDLADFEGCTHRLRLALAFYPDSGLDAHLEQAEEALGQLRDWQRVSKRVAGLLAEAQTTGVRAPLEQAAALQAEHPGLPLRAQAYLEAWDQADLQAQRVASAVEANDYPAARAAVVSIRRLGETWGLPHVDTLRVTTSAGVELGPGVQLVAAEIERLVVDEERLHTETERRLRLFAVQTQGFEGRYKDAIVAAQRDDGDQDARRHAGELSVEVRSALQKLLSAFSAGVSPSARVEMDQLEARLGLMLTAQADFDEVRGARLGALKRLNELRADEPLQPANPPAGVRRPRPAVPGV